MTQHLSGPATLEGQVALITGAAGGMGRAVAAAFCAAGATVVATDLADAASFDAGIEYLRYDVTSRADTDL
ncbi:MAG: SDR family NAD(P)-dependent oxidoreductase [Xenophilus sp.]